MAGSGEEFLREVKYLSLLLKILIIEKRKNIENNIIIENIIII